MRKFFLILLVTFPIVVCAQTSNLSQGYDFLAKQCNDLDCIQANMDMIDGQIAALISKRLAFVKRGAEIKNTNVLAPKTVGYGNISERAGEQAKAMGSSASTLGGVFDAIQKQSEDYEKQYLKPVEKPKSSESKEATPTETQ